MPVNYASNKLNQLLIIVEGEKKTALLDSRGIRALGISGVGNWFDDAARAIQRENGDGLNKETLPHAILLSEALQAQMVIVLVDSDAHRSDKRDIRAGMEALKLALDHYIQLAQANQAAQPAWDPILTPRNIPVMLAICPPEWVISPERSQDGNVTGCTVEMHRLGIDDLYMNLLAMERERANERQHGQRQDAHRLDEIKVTHRLKELLISLGLADLGVDDAGLGMIVASENQRQLAFKARTWMEYSHGQGVWSEADASNEFAAPLRVADKFESAHRVIHNLVEPITDKVGEVPENLLTRDLRQWIDLNEGFAKGLQSAAFRLKCTRPQKDILTQTKRMVHILPERWNADKDVFACASGLIDLRTGKLSPHSPEHLITMRSKIAYDPLAECPKWDGFLLQSQPDQAVRRYLQALMGYAATGHTNMNEIYFFKGSGGNGKGVFIETLRWVMGSFSMVASKTLVVKQHNTTPHPTDKASLEGKRWATLSELADSGALDASALKELSGGNELTAHKMHKDFGDFQMQATITCDTNDVPYISDNSPAIMRRLVVIDWPISFIGNPDRQLR